MRCADSKMTCAKAQANYPIAGEIHGLLGSREQAKFRRPSPSIRVKRSRIFDE